ncbi:MAG: hypothetical protein JST80_01745 [Bdellovibrionales bacterium]|nr:hypothetical protein [Bdellovibrionales bacterium]
MISMKLPAFSLFSLAFLSSIVTFAQSPDYPAIFKKAREVYQSSTGAERKQSAKTIPESVVVELLQKNPSKLSESRQELINDVQAESKTNPDPTKHLRLIPPEGQPGYSELELFVDHDYYSNGATVLKSNLIKVWGDFLKQARKQIILNVFDFDLMEIAQILADKATKQNVDVRVGIDKNVIAARPEVKAIADFLSANRVKVSPIDSVGLNHQKTASIDWENKNTARVLFSSGNLTQSCLGPEGDLKDIPASKRPKGSVPNANHVMTMKSWLLANLVQHELTKTLDQRFSLRGSEYPTTGSYQVTGPGVNPQTLEAYPEPSMVITFAPGGSYRKINKNLIAFFIKKADGPIRMAQFAYSSADVANALRARAIEGYQQKGKFDFKSVGDTPFAMQKWSQFLKMSGLKQEKSADGKKKTFIEDRDDPWTKELTKVQLDDLRKNVKIGPPEYRNSKITIDGISYDLSAKIHHKILVMSPFAILGTSFNFSDGAESNNEQIIVWHDQKLVKAGEGMVNYLFDKSRASVYGEAQRRNSTGESDADVDDNAGDR